MPKILPVIFSSLMMCRAIWSLKFFLRRPIAFNDLAAAKHFGRNDKAWRNRQSQTLQHNEVEAFIAQVNEPGDPVIRIGDGGHCVIGVVNQQLVQFILRKFIRLLEQYIENTAEKAIELLEPQ